MRLAISTTETLTDLKTDLVVANNNNNNLFIPCLFPPQSSEVGWISPFLRSSLFQMCLASVLTSYEGVRFYLLTLTINSYRLEINYYVYIVNYKNK